ncbi:MAG: hypothetical protein H9W81_10110 [Enterococcus sp.]|nr:hypothetical protein [Enterococcus sp.]
MCYTGGPRCYGDAKTALSRAKADYEANPTPENEEAYKDAKRDYLLTPEVIDQIRQDDPERAEKLQSKYDVKLQGAKDYERYRKESSRTLERLEKEKLATMVETNSINEKISKLDRHYETVVEQIEMGMVTTSEENAEEDLNKINTRIKALQERRNTVASQRALIDERIKTVEAANETNLDRRKNGLPLHHTHLMPEKFAGYFADTERKHFNTDTAGSTFTETKNLNEVLTLAARQRKNLEGDDREKLIARGADPSSFASDKRYLMVETKGKLGMTLASELSDDTPLTVVQKNEKAKPICVAEVKSHKNTDFATIVLVDNPTLPGTEHHPSLLITAFPGASGPSGSNNDLLPYVGKSMSVAEARKIYGRDFEVNTIVKP